MRVRLMGGLVGLAVLPAAARADDGVPRILLDLALEPHAVRLVALDARNVTYIDAHGLMQSESLSQYVALLPSAEPAAVAPAPTPTEPRAPDSTVDLADGQRFVGLPTGKAGDQSAMEWSSSEFPGPIPIPLEVIRRVTFRPAGAISAPPAAAARDALILLNGDVLEGFVESIGDPTGIEQDSGVVEVPLERIAEVRLGGPAKNPVGTMVWLRSGTAALVTFDRTTQQGELSMLLAPMDSTEGGTESHKGVIPIGDLMAAAFDMSRLTPLASLSPGRQAGGPDRVYSEPLRIGDSVGAVLGALDIEFPGPMSVTWTLPAGAARLGGSARLPEDCRTWGDCVLVMSVGAGAGEAQEVFRASLSAAAPEAAFNVALPTGTGAGATLTATIDAGQYGPIQDRVVLERAVLLMSADTRPGQRPTR